MIKSIMKFLPAIFLLVICMAISCNSKTVDGTASIQDTTSVSTTIKYAKGFTITKGLNYQLLEVNKPFKGAEKGFRYLLIPKGTAPPANVEADRVIKVPVASIATTSTSHLPALDLLGVSNHLVGFPNTDLITSRNIRMLVDQGNIIDIGPGSQIDLETLIEASPELIMDFAMGSTYDQFERLQETGIPVVLNADYLEETPLGRAEWIKFTAAFFVKDTEADSVFRRIEENYLRLKAKAKDPSSYPMVYTGIVYGDIWYQPGGRSYAARFINDAAGNYVWSHNSESGSLALNFEEVYAQAHNADYWIGVGSYNSLAEIGAQDPRYKQFDAFKEAQVYNYNARIGATGGNEFLELGYARPDMVLADLLYILHPELLPGHQLYFYKKLN